jgi:hypothetical protein
VARAARLLEERDPLGELRASGRGQSKRECEAEKPQTAEQRPGAVCHLSDPSPG